MPESKQCYDLIDEDLTRSDTLKEPVASLDSVLGSSDSKTIEEYFLNCCEYGCLQNVKALLDVKAHLINVRDSDGYTGMHRASYNGHVDVISTLISAGASVASRTEDGWQPLHCACRWSMKIIK